MDFIASLLIGLGIACIVYAFPAKSTAVGKRLAVVAGVEGEKEKTLATKLGGRLSGYLPESIAARVREEVEILKLVRSPWTTETIYGLMVLSSIGGAALGYLALGSIGLLGCLVAPFVVLQVLQGKANSVRRQLRRELPDVINIMAVELASGANVVQALESASTSPTLFGQWLRTVLVKHTGADLLGTGGKGRLVEEAEKLNMPELVSFAHQLESVNRMGIGGAETLSNLAKETSRRYLADVNARVAKLESELALPSVLFFFLPFVFVLLALTGISLVASGVFGR